MVDLLFDWFGISCMTTDNFCFYLQNRLIQTGQTGGPQYNDTSPFSIPCVYTSISMIFSCVIKNKDKSLFLSSLFTFTSTDMSLNKRKKHFCSCFSLTAFLQYDMTVLNRLYFISNSKQKNCLELPWI
jgi:hypothetical protein